MFDMIMEVAYGFIVIVGLAANILVIVVYTRDKRNRNMTQLVLHLTIADILHLVSSITILTKLADNHLTLGKCVLETLNYSNTNIL